VQNEAAVVTFQEADGQEKAYAFVYLSEGNPYLGHILGAQLSRLAWDFFRGRYGPSPAP